MILYMNSIEKNIININFIMKYNIQLNKRPDKYLHLKRSLQDKIHIHQQNYKFYKDKDILHNLYLKRKFLKDRYQNIILRLNSMIKHIKCIKVMKHKYYNFMNKACMFKQLMNNNIKKDNFKYTYLHSKKLEKNIQNTLFNYSNLGMLKRKVSIPHYFNNIHHNNQEYIFHQKELIQLDKLYNPKNYIINMN